MEKKFNSNAIPLAQMLHSAEQGELQLPDFQRGWVWDDDHIRSLLASISLSYPIGAVMTLQTGNPDVKFRPRPLEGVEGSYAEEPQYLLLDGQQRATSLFLSLKAKKPVETTDARGKEIRRWYYADIERCLDPFGDREEAIRSVPEDRRVKEFGRDVVLDISTRDLEIANEMFPLSLVLDPGETMNWQLAYLEHGPGDRDERLQRWKRFNQLVISPFTQYQVPSIDLVKSTPKEAVCQVFEKVNTGGVSLTVFELLTATYAAEEFQLRDDWRARRERFDEHAVLSRFQATDFLQIVTLLATYDRRQAFLDSASDNDRVPPIACKRRDVLQLSLANYEKWADVATEALLSVVPFLHGEKLFAARDLPYQSQLVPLTALFAVLQDRADSHGVREKLRRWFWCGVFGEMYGGSTETRFANDLGDVLDWLDGGDEPRTVKEAQLQAERLLTLRSRNSAAYKGLYALQMRRGGRDFRTGNPIDVHAYFDDAIDVHHIFPRKWCRENAISDGIANCVVNKTAIDAKTNRRIGGNAPSDYLNELEQEADISAEELDTILESHDIDPVALRQDDFQRFFNERFEALLKQIESVMGKEPNRSQDEDESPFVDVEVDEDIRADQFTRLIERCENDVLEFKSTGRHNIHTQQRDDNIEWAVVKTLAGFLNARGGTLLLGVADDGSVTGLERDYATLSKGDRDGYELWLTNLVSKTLGKLAATCLSVSFAEVKGKDVCRIDADPAESPTFATPVKGPQERRFYVRIGNSTQSLDGEELLQYRQKRWD